MPTVARRVSEPESSNRRLYPRRRGHFPASYHLDPATALPAFGLDISGGGLCLLTRERVPHERLAHLTIVGMIDGRQVRFEASGRWFETVRSRGATQFRYGLRLRTIADADWNFIMAHSTDAKAGAERGKVLTSAQRDAMLPLETQHRIAKALDRAGRIVHQPETAMPLIEYRFEGYEMRAGIPYYRLNVRSRIGTADGPVEHRTPVLAGIETPDVKTLID